MKSFADRLAAAIREKNSVLMVGIDPLARLVAAGGFARGRRSRGQLPGNCGTCVEALRLRHRRGGGPVCGGG